MPKVLDVRDFQPKSDTLTVELTHPTQGGVLTNEDDSPWSVTFYAPHSKEYKEYLWSVSDKRIEESRSSSGASDFTAKDLDASGLDLLINTISEWSIPVDGSVKPYDKSVARELLEDIPWIRTQLERGVLDAQVFTQA